MGIKGHPRSRPPFFSHGNCRSRTSTCTLNRPEVAAHNLDIGHFQNQIAASFASTRFASSSTPISASASASRFTPSHSEPGPWTRRLSTLNERHSKLSIRSTVHSPATNSKEIHHLIRHYHNSSAIAPTAVVVAVGDSHEGGVYNRAAPRWR